MEMRWGGGVWGAGAEIPTQSVILQAWGEKMVDIILSKKGIIRNAGEYKN